MSALKLAKIATELNISYSTLGEIIKKHDKGFSVKPNTRLSEKHLKILEKHFKNEPSKRKYINELIKQFKQETQPQKDKEPKPPSEEGQKITTTQPEKKPKPPLTEISDIGPKIVGYLDLDKKEKEKEKTATKKAQQTPKATTKTEAKTEPTPKAQTKPQPTETQKTAETKEAAATDILEQIDQIYEQFVEKKSTEKQTIETKTPVETATKAETTEEKTTPKPEPQPTAEEEKVIKAEAPDINVKIVGEIPEEKLKALEQEEKTKTKSKTKEPKKPKPKTEYRKPKPQKKPKPKSKRQVVRDVEGKKYEKIDIDKIGRKIKQDPTKLAAKQKKKQKEEQEKAQIIDQAEISKTVTTHLTHSEGKISKSIQKIRSQKKKLKKQQKEQEATQKSKTLVLTEFLTLKELANLMDVDPVELLSKAIQGGIAARSINHPLEAEEIELLAEEYGYKVEFVDIITLEELETKYEDKEEDLVPRPPIVTVMGHVDHGKTTLLDYIRNTNVVAGEAGGITQHIGAYNVTLDDGRQITFIDTPGHEAFTAMRARGAKVTDIAVIVVAADDGVRPQTLEALDHAKAAGVPIIFAINKIDKPTADPDRVRRELAERNYLVASWGGDYFDVEISAKTGQNVDELLETILLVAEDLDLKANPNRPAVGTILEAWVERGRGPVANVLVRTGTLRKGDIILAGSHYGKVRAMFNERMQQIKEAGPSIPAQVMGLDGAPEPGEPFMVMADEKEAKKKALERQKIKRIISEKSRRRYTLEEISRRLQEGEVNEINIIIRADVQGTADALAEQLAKLSTDEVKVNIIRAAVGEISESDVMLAHVSKAIIIGFQVRPSAIARKRAEEKNVEIRTYSVIYEAIEDVKNAIKGMLKPKVKEEYLGRAKVLKTFKIKGVGTVGGLQVIDGKITKDAHVRVIRNGKVVYEGEVASLKHYQSDVDEVFAPQECGLAIKNFNDIKKDDEIEAFKRIEIAPEL